jgi:hypothetical protein
MTDHTIYSVTTGSAINGVDGVGAKGAEVLAPVSYGVVKPLLIDGLAGGYVDVLNQVLLKTVKPVKCLDTREVPDPENSGAVLSVFEGSAWVVNGNVLSQAGAQGVSGPLGVMSAEYLVEAGAKRYNGSLVVDLVDRGIAGTGATYEVGTASGSNVGGASGVSYCILIANPAVLGAVASAVEGQKQVDAALMSAARAASDAAIAAVRASSAIAMAKMAESQALLTSYNGVVGSVEAARKTMVTGDCGIDPATGKLRGDLLSAYAYAVDLGDKARDKALVGFEGPTGMGFEGNYHVSGTLYSAGEGVPRVVRLYDLDSGELVGSTFSGTLGGFRFNGIAPGEYFVASHDLGLRDPTFAIRGITARA